MKHVLAAAFDLQAFCAERDWRFCFIGGIAIQRWGEPRYTKDADITLLTGYWTEEPFVDALLARFAPRRPDARAFALRHRVLLLLHENGVQLDIGLGALPFEEATIARSSLWKVKQRKLRTCCAEDLVIHKAYASRERDWVDVEGILSTQGRKLDLELIWRELRPLAELKESPEILTRLQRLLDKHLD